MSTNDPQIPEGGPPAELGDPTDSVDQGTGSPVPAVDVAGQEAPSPDTVGVSEGQEARDTSQTGDDVVIASGERAGTDEAEASREEARIANNAPPAAPVPNVEPTEDYGEQSTVNLLDDPDAAFDTGEDDTVLVRASDPVLGPVVGRWLERQAARDARLSPLVGAINLLPELRFAFRRDDPIFTAGAPAQEPEPRQQPQLIG